MLQLGAAVRLLDFLVAPYYRVAFCSNLSAADAETGQLEKSGGRKRRVGPIAGEARRGADQLF